MKRRTFLLLTVLLPLLAPSVGMAQSRARFGTSPTILESYQKATTLLAQAIDAHGGLPALQEARQIRITQRGYDYHRTQGRRLGKPYDSTLRTLDLMLDLNKNQMVNVNTSGWPGGFHYKTWWVTNGDKHFTITPRNRNYTPAAFPPVREQFNNLFAVPQWYLIEAHETRFPGSRRYLGRVRLGQSSTEVDAIAFNHPTNNSVVIGLDPTTRRLRAILNMVPDVFAGDADTYTEFLDWRMQDSVLMPSRLKRHRGGELTSDLRFTSVARRYAIPDSMLTPPADFTAAAANPTPKPVAELAPGVWMVGTGSASLLVAFNDHLVAVDAPANGSAGVITQARTIAPGKPIRYVVPTHHHDDHFSGVRLHAAAGATVLTTPGNIEYLRRVMTAPMSTLIPAGSQAPATSSYRVETIDGSQRVFTDGTRTMEIHRIASPHAEEMLIAWLPAEGILYHADLIEAPAAGVALAGANAEATLHLARVIKEKGWNVRVFAGAHSTLAGPAAFAELVALPIIPPFN